MLLIKFRLNEKQRNSNKNDYKHSKTVPSSAAIPSTNLRKYSTCSHSRHHLLQLALVVFFLGALADLLLCAQMNRHTCSLYCVVVVVVVGAPKYCM